MSRYKKPSKLVTCPQCGKQVRARGLVAHFRRTHPGLSLEAIKSLPKPVKPATKVTTIRHPATIADLLAKMGVERPKSSLESPSSERVSHFSNLGQELAAIAWDREQYRRLGELDAATEEYLSDLVRQARIKWRDHK
jgi:hypothetical protein